MLIIHSLDYFSSCIKYLAESSTLFVHRSHFTCAASSPMSWNHLWRLMNRGFNTRCCTWGFWRMCGWEGRALPIGWPTLGSCRGGCQFWIFWLHHQCLINLEWQRTWNSYWTEVSPCENAEKVFNQILEEK